MASRARRRHDHDTFAAADSCVTLLISRRRHMLLIYDVSACWRVDGAPKSDAMLIIQPRDSAAAIAIRCHMLR